MFRGYLNDEQRYQDCFVGRWYRSGDLARRDEDGYIWFVGRNDDLIKSAGHLIGPFEVESALTEHASVVEAGVIGKPDETVGAIVKAFVVLAAGVSGSEELRTGTHRATPESGWARPWPPGRSNSLTRCRTPAAARSCAVS